MLDTIRRRLAPTLLLAALAAACDDAASVATAPALELRGADLGVCAQLQVPTGNRLSFRAYAAGDQVYRWDGTAWVFVEPAAVLYADAGFHGAVAVHYAGPTWESNSGSKVVGAAVDRCTANSNAIPWLLLSATSTQGPGIFERTTFIQRVNTVGGKAPAAPGNAAGEIARVPYTAEYLFYRQQ